MKNLILQIWDSPALPPVAALSSEQVRAYAFSIGAHYVMLNGKLFEPTFTAQAQKLVMLDPRFDDYGDVAMFDCDMLPVKGLADDLFALPGCGFHQETAHARVCKLLPRLTSAAAPFFGGPLYKFDRATRQALRAVVHLPTLRLFDTLAHGYDEGMVHHLCVRAGLDLPYLPEAWAWGSIRESFHGAKFIHLRRDRLAVYQSLRERNILD